MVNDMYKETNSADVGLGTIVVFVAAVVFLRTALNILPTPPLANDIVYITVIAAYVLLLIKRYLCTYEYTLTAGQLIITTQLGGRERGRVEADLGAIVCFCPADDERLKSYNAKAQTLCTRKGSKYAVILDTDEGRVKLIFAPTENMVTLIQSKLYPTAEEE